MDQQVIEAPAARTSRVLLNPSRARTGVCVSFGADDAAAYRIVGATRRTVTLVYDRPAPPRASGRGWHSPSRFDGKRYQCRWDGTGFARGGQHLYVADFVRQA